MRDLSASMLGLLLICEEAMERWGGEMREYNMCGGESNLIVFHG